MSAFLQTGFIALGKSTFNLFVQFFQYSVILNSGEMPRLESHTTGGIGCRFQNGA